MYIAQIIWRTPVNYARPTWNLKSSRGFLLQGAAWAHDGCCLMSKHPLPHRTTGWVISLQEALLSLPSSSYYDFHPLPLTASNKLLVVRQRGLFQWRNQVGEKQQGSYYSPTHESSTSYIKLFLQEPLIYLPLECLMLSYSTVRSKFRRTYCTPSQRRTLLPLQHDLPTPPIAVPMKARRTKSDYFSSLTPMVSQSKF